MDCAYYCDMRAAIPNALTLGNLIMGLLALLALFKMDQPVTATYCVLAALVLDVFDGAVARALKVSGELGKQLDSLADAVSFGVVPGMTAYWLMDFWWTDQSKEVHASVYLALLIPLAAVLRLARFNIDTRQTHYFIGLPTPSAAAVIMSLPLVMSQRESLTWWVTHPLLIGVLSVVLSAAMLAPIPLVSLKAQKNGKGLHWIVVFLAVMALPAFWFLGAMAVPLVVCLYLLMSMIFFRPQ